MTSEHLVRRVHGAAEAPGATQPCTFQQYYFPISLIKSPLIHWQSSLCLGTLEVSVHIKQDKLQMRAEPPRF